MKRALILIVLAALLAAPAVAPAYHTRVYIGVGPVWWGDPFWPYPYYPYWGRPPYWGYPPPLYPPAVVEESPVYVQRASPPPVSAERELQAGYWYYCPSPSGAGYYPLVPTCPEAWVQVPPRP